MMVFYEFEVNATEEQKHEMFSGESGEALKELKLFVIQRWKVLDHEIESCPDHWITIRLQTDPFRIAFAYRNLPQSLVDRMEQSISTEDLKYLAAKFNKF